MIPMIKLTPQAAENLWRNNPKGQQWLVIFRKGTARVFGYFLSPRRFATGTATILTTYFPTNRRRWVVVQFGKI